jgi:hypothetical protein
MNFKSPLSFFFIAIALFLTTGCNKVEGPGGAATIKGIIHVQEYDGANNLINEYDAPKFDVYIIYGNEEGETYFDDDIETSFDGALNLTISSREIIKSLFMKTVTPVKVEEKLK